MNVNMFFIKYMHKIRQKHTDFRFLITGMLRWGVFKAVHLDFCGFVPSLVWELSVNKSDQMLYIIFFLALLIVKLIRISAAGGKSVRIILAIKQMYSRCLCTSRTSRYLCVSLLGFCANVNYICVKCCLSVYAITSTLPCTLSCYPTGP